jgi:hypothetical protein
VRASAPTARGELTAAFWTQRHLRAPMTEESRAEGLDHRQSRAIRITELDDGSSAAPAPAHSHSEVSTMPPVDLAALKAGHDPSAPGRGHGLDGGLDS